MKLTSKLLSVAAVTALVLGAICLCVSPALAQGKGKGKPSFAGKSLTRKWVRAGVAKRR